MLLRLSSLAALVALVLFVTSGVAAAQEAMPKLDFSKLSFTPPAASRSAVVRFDQPTQSPERSRPSILMTSLYATTAVTQSLDAHSTMKAINAGGQERNPMMSYLTSHPAAFGAVKAATAAGLIFAGRSLAKHNKKHAVIALVAVNSAYALIAVHNYRVANGLQGR